MAMRNKLKQFLESKNLSVYRFQKDTGIAPKTAYDLVNDESKIPAPKVLEAICDAYEVQPGDLLEWIKSA